MTLLLLSLVSHTEYADAVGTGVKSKALIGASNKMLAEALEHTSVDLDSFA